MNSLPLPRHVLWSEQARVDVPQSGQRLLAVKVTALRQVGFMTLQAQEKVFVLFVDSLNSQSNYSPFLASLPSDVVKIAVIKERTMCAAGLRKGILSFIVDMHSKIGEPQIASKKFITSTSLNKNRLSYGKIQFRNESSYRCRVFMRSQLSNTLRNKESKSRFS